MKLSNENKERAKEIFAAQPKVDRLFINDKGEFFTSKSFADNSSKEVVEISRLSILEETETLKESSVVKVDYFDRADFKVGDVATVSGEPADGEFQISETEIGLFVEGELVEVSELKAQ